MVIQGQLRAECCFGEARPTRHDAPRRSDAELFQVQRFGRWQVFLRTARVMQQMLRQNLSWVLISLRVEVATYARRRSMSDETSKVD